MLENEGELNKKLIKFKYLKIVWVFVDFKISLLGNCGLDIFVLILWREIVVMWFNFLWIICVVVCVWLFCII